jgi:hypothetical protein
MGHIKPHSGKTLTSFASKKGFQATAVWIRFESKNSIHEKSEKYSSHEPSGQQEVASLFVSLLCRALSVWVIWVYHPAVQAGSDASLRPSGTPRAFTWKCLGKGWDAHSPSRGTRKEKMWFSLLKTLKLHPYKGYLWVTQVGPYNNFDPNPATGLLMTNDLLGM